MIPLITENFKIEYFAHYKIIYEGANGLVIHFAVIFTKTLRKYQRKIENFINNWLEKD